MHIPQFAVQDFDEVAFLTLKMQPGISSVREKVGGAVIYTISDDARESGHFAARPGPRISPEVMLEIFSRAAGVRAAAPWFAFHSMPHSFEAVDERDRHFRTLCQLIFTRFVMRHGLDMAGRPTTLWEYALQEEMTGTGGADRRIDNIRVPEKQLILQRWRVTWRKIKGQWDQGKCYTDICNWLEKVHSDLVCSPDTLKDIIHAGEAGLLD